MQNIKIGFSTCPNDTYIFEAMIHGRIDTEGLTFEPYLADVEELNKLALENKLDITKLSYHAFCYVDENYLILDAGSALGFGNGPLLISKRQLKEGEINKAKIAIPGKYTTANLLLGIAFPEAQNKHEYLFSDIENAVVNENVDAGLIIHENRFTYQAKGLKKIIDLGEYWEKTYHAAIPLGGIVINRRLDTATQQKVNRVLKRSIQYAYNNPQQSSDYIRQYAQELSPDVIRKHIELYVNDYTSSLGETGKKAIKSLISQATEKQLIPQVREDIFIK